MNAMGEAFELAATPIRAVDILASTTAWRGSTRDISHNLLDFGLQSAGEGSLNTVLYLGALLNAHIRDVVWLYRQKKEDKTSAKIDSARHSAQSIRLGGVG